MTYVCIAFSAIVVVGTLLLMMGLARSAKLGTRSEAMRGIRPEDDT